MSFSAGQREACLKYTAQYRMISLKLCSGCSLFNQIAHYKFKIIVSRKINMILIY